MTNQTFIQAQDFVDQVKPLSAKQRQETNNLFVKKYTQDPSYGYDFMGEEGRFQYCDWQVYEGDLIVESHFRCNMPLVITGNLIVKGNYIDDAVGGVIVYGNMEVEKNILSEYPILVVGNTKAKGLICLHYNDYGCEFLGDIECDILYTGGRAVEIVGNIKAQSHCDEDDINCLQTKLKEEIFEEDDGDFFLDIAALTKLLVDDDNIYKEEGGTTKKERRIIETISNADKVLVLSDLKLKEIPAEVFAKTNLEELSIDGNNIKQLPTALAKLTKLKQLNISHNRDIKFSVISKLENLEILNISHIGYHDITLPDFSFLNKLHTLIMADGGAHKITNPHVLGELENLQALVIAAKYIYKGSPEFIPEVHALKNLKKMKVTGSVPKEYKELIKKEYPDCEVFFER